MNKAHRTFLRRLRAGGRSNMYGAVPYLMNAFAVDREQAFRIICEWLDLEAATASGEGPSPTPTVARTSRRGRSRAA
jgi:hypothetical protein